MIKCYHCSGKHISAAEVKACSKVTIAFAAKVETGKIVETVIPATVKTVSVPAHRTSAAYLALKAKVAPVPAHEPISAFTPAEVQIFSSPVTEIKMGQSLEIGMYQLTNAETGEVTIYKVKFNKHNTYKYAEKLSITTSAKWDIDSNSWIDMPKGKFWFAPGVINKLTSNDKMTEAQAKAFHDATKAKYGVDYGFCCVCGKLLTVKKSIDAGIGPKCATYFA